MPFLQTALRLACLAAAASLSACSGSASPGAAAATAPVVGSAQTAPAAVRVDPPVDVPPPPPVERLTCGPCRKIAFTSSRDGNDEIYTVNADGTELTRLTDDPASDDYAAWSPDGTRIAFTRGNDDASVLVVMDADGGNPVRYSLPHAAVYYPTWSADGTKIAYAAVSEGSLNLWTVGADGGYPTALFSAPGWDGHPAWSPDGTKIALSSDWLAYDFVYDVFVIAPDGSGFTLVTDGNIFDHLDHLWPAWSHDGAKLATTMRREVGRDQYVAWVVTMNRDGSGLKALIAAAPESRSSWSPDGSAVAFTAGSTGAYDVAWIRADGSAQGTIVTNGRNPAWQP